MRIRIKRSNFLESFIKGKVESYSMGFFSWIKSLFGNVQSKGVDGKILYAGSSSFVKRVCKDTGMTLDDVSIGKESGYSFVTYKIYVTQGDAGEVVIGPDLKNLKSVKLYLNFGLGERNMQDPKTVISNRVKLGEISSAEELAAALTSQEGKIKGILIKAPMQLDALRARQNLRKKHLKE